VAQQGAGPPRSTRASAPGARDQGGSSADPLDTDEEYPAWAVPEPLRPPRGHRNALRRGQAGSRRAEPDGEARHAGGNDGEERRVRRLVLGRAHATRARRAKRRIYVWGGLAGGAAIIAVVVFVLLPGGSGPSTAGANGFVTTYLPGELRSVPDTCDSVSASTLGQYLPGKLTKVALPGLSGNSSNQCDWTLDRRPVYRLLEVTATAYAPSGLASGNGSATSAAKDAYSQAMQGELHPPRKSHQPKAQVTAIGGLGTAAFSAFQVITAGGDTTERVTVVARFRNALVTVEFSGLDHADQGGYGPVSASQLRAGAAAAATDVLRRIG